MNKILKVLALGAMALSTTACSDFLEVNPRTQVSETEFYKTEDDMMKGLYAVMNEMQTRMPEVWSYSSLLGDESETGSTMRAARVSLSPLITVPASMTSVAPSAT